jgi:hypothetical protein
VAEPRRVLLGLTEVGGYYTNLAAGLRELGIAVEVVTIHRHAFAYDVGTPTGVQRLVWAIAGPRRPGPRTPVAVAREVVVRLLLLLWAPWRFDSFVFGFRNSFLATWDLALLRLLRKRIVCVFHGTDSRAPYLDGTVVPEVDVATLHRRTRGVKALVRRVERYADVVVCNPLSAHLHERPVVPFQILGVPAPIGVDLAAPVPPAPARPRIVHAPSVPAAKGTPAIRAAVEQVRDGREELDYVELVGRANRDVLDELARCSFAVDQLYSDTTLAGFAAEAAALGRPAVIGGYDHDELAAILGPDGVAPARYCRPEEVGAAVAELLDDADAAAALGREAREFMRREWNRVAVAGRLLRLLAGDVPDGWLYDPSTLRATGGCCLSREAAISARGALVAAHGPSALQVDDKPALRAALLAELP